jgi:hypothetical protein
VWIIEIDFGMKSEQFLSICPLAVDHLELIAAFVEMSETPCVGVAFLGKCLAVLALAAGIELLCPILT